MEKTSKIWMNGKFVDWDDAEIHVLTNSLHYGSGVFEGIRCYKTKNGPAVFRLREHVDRIFASAELLNIKIPFTKKEIFDAIVATVKENKIHSCYIRPIAYFGYGEMGLNIKLCKVDVAIAVWPWGAYLGEEAMKHGTKLMISKYKRHHGPLNKAKITGNYYNSSLAKSEALDAKYDDAIMMDDQGYVAEATGENIFLIKNGVLYTPAEGSMLLGITRDSIFKIAEDMGLDVIEKDITKEELYSADEALLSGTAAEITPIHSVDGNKMKRIDIVFKLQRAYFDIVNGKNEKYVKWLTLIK